MPKIIFLLMNTSTVGCSHQDNCNSDGLRLSILRMMDKSHTLNEIAVKLNKNEHIVLSVIEHLLHDGYIAEIHCGGGCSKMCDGCIVVPSAKMYVITNKGRDFIHKHTQVKEI